MIGKTVRKPLSGTLSGHAAGEPFDKLVFALIKEKFPGKTFRQYEFLNALYTSNPKATTYNERLSLIPAPALAYLLSRKPMPTLRWTTAAQFEEKQDDTADIIVQEKAFANLIDVKTYNLAKAGQAPNIISATKLAKMCALILDSKNFTSHDITYVGVTWTMSDEFLKCSKVTIKELFKANPAKLYVNWAAATQLQFHIDDLDQTYTQSTDQWCKDFIRNFVNQARSHTDKTIKKYVDPYLEYLK